MSNGTITPTISMAKALPVTFCGGCGALAHTEAQFCSACGEGLAPGAPTTAPEPPTTMAMPAPPATAPAPAADPQDSREEPPPMSKAPRHLGVRRAAIAAVVLAALGAAGAAGAMRLTDHSAQDARASLRAARTGVDQVVAQLHTARDLGDLRAAGRVAQRQAEVLGAESARLDVIKGKDAGRKALAVIGAERRILEATAALTHLDPARIGTWPQARARLAAAGAQLTPAAREVGSLGPAAALAPSAGALGAALAADDRLVAGARTKLGTWRRAYRRARRAQRRQVAALATYGTAVGASLATYNGLRGDLDRWISDMGGSTIPFGQAFDELTAAADRRKDVRDAIAALNPPQRLAAAHASLLAVLSDAIVAMTDAGDAAQECTSDPTCFDEDFRNTPQWRSFSDASRRITGQFGLATQRWQQAVARMRASIHDRHMPTPPAV